MLRKYNNIIVSGSLAYDRIMDFPGKFFDHILPDKIHEINLSFAIPALTEEFGGTAGNIAYSLSLLGFKPLILARAGNDFAKYQSWLKKNKLPIFGIKISQDKPTASAYIITDKADNQIAGFNMGAMLNKNTVQKKLIKKNSLAIISPDLPINMISHANCYARKKIKFIFDPGQQLIQFSARQLKKFITQAEVLISNDYELSLLLKKTKLTEVKLKSKIPVLITTLGARGSVIASDNKVYKIKAIKLKNIIDPTGAGDAFRAGLIVGLVNNLSWLQCGAVASTTASFAIEHYGTQAHNYTLSEFNRRLKKYFGFIYVRK